LLASKLEEHATLKWGTYHFSGTPYVTWYGFANIIIDKAKEVGLVTDRIGLHAVSSNMFPTLAQRPNNSCIDNQLIGETFGIFPDNWSESLCKVLLEILDTG
jgi:dTDP-4-dehydrorhamnose reductase